MRTLKRLFYVACTAFLLTSCEETYNDKLFWPGELCQEYGSYIKPATLNLTYSGEKLVGKTVDFKTEDSEKGTLTLNDIIPGEKQTPLPISLCEQEDSYTFSGKNITMGGATVTYSGAITPKTMKLDLRIKSDKKRNMEYNHKEIEKRWQQYWKDNNIYKTDIDAKRPKFYVLDMFPYPSGAGLHVGHPLGYIASDIF